MERPQFLLTIPTTKSILDKVNFISRFEEVRMKKLFVLSLLLIFLSSLGVAQNWFQGSLDDAVAKAKSEDKLVLIDFFSDG